VTAQALLDHLRAKGVAVAVKGDMLSLKPASVLSREDREQARALKPDLMRLLAPAAAPRPTPAFYLAAALRRWFELTVSEVDGVRPDLPEVEALYQEIVRLTDDTGALSAEALTLEAARLFRSETGRCAWCGLLGHAEDLPHPVTGSASRPS
jgi:tubulysin polyketide synthase-like protein